ncbi:MAG: helix-turn-helix transcriptional regulator [Bacilli bacterium]|nr:helix-turn-helix transcriptional regulator [Bacilli bacterium]
MEFKDKLRKLRMESGLTQEALADAVHISRSAIAKYENGNGMPSGDTLKAIAFFFGVEAAELESDETQSKRKRKRILKWSLIAAGSAAAIAGVVVLVLALTIPFRSKNGPINEPAITGIGCHVFQKDGDSYSLMQNHGGCFAVYSGNDCYVAPTLSYSGEKEARLQSDAVSFSSSHYWTVDYLEGEHIWDYVVYKVHFDYPGFIGTRVEMKLYYQSFGTSLLFDLL